MTIAGRMDDMSSDAGPPLDSFFEHLHDYGVTVSLSGEFIPSSLQPARLTAEGVLTADDARDPKDYWSQPDFARFTAGPLTFEASRAAIEISARGLAHEPRVVDAAVPLLGVLPPCPVREVSIARYGHFALAPDQHPVDLVSSAFESVSPVPRDDAAQAPADSPRLAARSWQGVVLPGAWSDLLRAPSLDELTMRGDRTDGREGSVVLTVEPSLIVPGGAFLAHIDIFQFPEADARTPRDAAGAEGASTLREAWEPTHEAAFRTFRKLRTALMPDEAAA